MEPESTDPKVTVVHVEAPVLSDVGVVKENKQGEVIGEICKGNKTEKAVTVQKKGGNSNESADGLRVKQEASPAVNTIIGKDEDGEVIDMSDIRVLEDLDTENKSPEKEEMTPNKAGKMEETDEEDSKDPVAKKRKSYEFFYPDMVSTLELALRGLPGMANCQQSKVIIPQKDPPPKGPLQMGSAQKRPTPIRDFAKEAKKALKKSGNIVEVRATRKSTRNATNPTKPVYNTGNVTAVKTINPEKAMQPQVLLDRIQVKESQNTKSKTSTEPVAKKARNTPKAAGKKTKVMPQAVAKQPKIKPQVVTKPVPVEVTTPKSKAVPSKSGQETFVVAPGGHQIAINYPPPAGALFRPSVTRSREWRKKGPGRSSRSKGSGLIVDNQKEIPTVMMKMRVSDTSDIVTTLDLAPPTKKLMQLKETEGSKVFAVPGRNLTPRLAWPLFYPNLLTKPREDDSDEDDDTIADDVVDEEDNLDGQKKCFTIIRSEPLSLSDSEDNIHYTNVLSDEDEDNVGPEYEPSTASVSTDEMNVEPNNTGTVSMETNVDNPQVIIMEEKTDSHQQTVSGATENISSSQMQEVRGLKSENITSQTIETSAETVILGGEVPTVESVTPPQVVEGGEVTTVECVTSPQVVVGGEVTTVECETPPQVGVGGEVTTIESVTPPQVVEGGEVTTVECETTSQVAVQGEEVTSVDSETPPQAAVQGEVTTVECETPPQDLAEVVSGSASNPVVVDTGVDTSVVDISMTSVGANEATIETVSASPPTSSTTATAEDGCVIVSVVTEISEPYVEQDGEIMIPADSEDNSDEKYILYMEK
ncbi:uncharacterized protein LOC132557464 [Ylistrum balloti]|uniref:uncharacterized protein LOC132557464 n=1 Tax=Ylistrum balloti TaxID=509963 RepID=UPI002905A06A|nr:uncharacterized protein LOC132557464 [Ylistrum balloti]